MGGSQFERTDLTESVFFGSDIGRSHMQYSVCYAADFRSASMVQCDLHKANFQEADLENADLRGATLTGTNLTGARVAGARFEGAIYDNETIFPSGVEASNLGMHRVGRGCVLQRVELTGVRLRDTQLHDAFLLGTDLSKAVLSADAVKGAFYDAKTQFPTGYDPQHRGATRIGSGSSMVNADLSGSQLSGLDFSRSTFIDVDFTEADCTGTDFRRCVFSHVDFTNTNLSAANFAWSIFLYCRLHTRLERIAHGEGTYVDTATEMPRPFSRSEGAFMPLHSRASLRDVVDEQSSRMPEFVSALRRSIHDPSRP